MRLPALLTSGATIALILGVSDIEAALISKSFQQGRASVIRLLAMSDMHGPSLGYCYVDLVEHRGIKSLNCQEVAERIRDLSEGIGVLLPQQGELLDTALEGIVREAWSEVEQQSPEGQNGPAK
jgi:hypothetical protein